MKKDNEIFEVTEENVPWEGCRFHYSCEETLLRPKQNPDCLHKDNCPWLKHIRDLEEYKQELKAARERRFKKQFEKFWKAYPTKENRTEAERVWNEQKPDSRLRRFTLKGLDRAKGNPEWMGNVPHPDRFLISEWHSYFRE